MFQSVGYYVCLLFFFTSSFSIRTYGISQVDLSASFAGKVSPFLVGITQLSTDPTWLRLIHYQKSWSGYYKSRVDDPDFFLAKNGSFDPYAELTATINAFVSPNKKVLRKGLMIHPICKYPARYAWLRTKVDLPRFEVQCEDYERFYRLIYPEKVWYVFSSYYFNNPSSSFGHSLLRFQRKARAGEKHNTLLDHGVNFAATPDTENPVLYALKGLSGGFVGNFSVLPYFYKVREYSDFESRDLWSYQLNLSKHEIERLVQHLWELGGTHFDYYFFSENCSYQLLALLEVAKPDLDILKRLPAWIIPSETVQVIKKVPGLVLDELFRPSLYRKFKTRQQQLNKKQKKQLYKLIASRDMSGLVTDLTEQETAQVYDAALDFTEYQAPSLLRKEDQDEALEDFKFRLLKARASIDHFSQDLKVPIPFGEKPDRGHGTARTSFGGAYSRHVSPYYLIEQRFAYHDFLDEVTGYPPHALIEFMNIRVKLLNNPKGGKAALERFSLLKIQSLKLFSLLEPEASWKLELGGKYQHFRSCQECLAAFGEAGVGLATSLGDDQHTIAGFISLPLYASLEPINRLGLGIKAQLQAMFQLAVANRLLLIWESALYSKEIIDVDSFSAELQHQSSSEFAMSVFMKSEGEEKILGSKLSYYY